MKIKGKKLFIYIGVFIDVIMRSFLLRNLQIFRPAVWETCVPISRDYFSGKNTGVVSRYSTLAFDNSKDVFEHKSTKELFRAFFVLHMCAIDPLVERSHKLLNIGERTLGPSIFGKILTPFYNQFVAGDSEIEMKRVANELSKQNINLMIAPVLETDIGEEQNSLKELFVKNYNKTLYLVRLSSTCKSHRNRFRPVCQTKITAHISADVLSGIAYVYNNLSISKRFSLVQDVAQILTKSRTGESISSLCENLPFSKLEREDLAESLPRLAHIGSLCKDLNVILAIDAEYTYVNPSINLIALSLMSVFNDDLPVIWNTYQGYLKNSKYWLTHDLELAQNLKVCFGSKIVRGAYLERERLYAAINNLPCPVNDSYEATNKCYDSLINHIIPIVAESNGRCEVVAATHNEESVKNAVSQMAAHGIPKSSPSFSFAQIYGMAENVSIPLAKAGFTVYKSVPYGSVLEVIPYLSRRANENRAVFRGARRERELLSQELFRRVFNS